jgi:hypothetical protein
MGHLRHMLITAVGAALLLAALPATALAGGPAPTIEGESASHISATDATLEAEINPGSGEDGFSLATTYEFFLESPWCGTHGPGFCEGTGGALVYKGTLPSGSKPQLVSVDLADVGHALSPGTTYGYRVAVANEVGNAFGGEQTLTTPPAGGAPAIESVSLTHLTATDATLEARIDTNDLSTSYEFQLWSSPCSHHGAGCELLIDVPLPAGLLLGSLVPQTVSLDLNSAGVVLGKGEYGFGVTARNKAGETSASGGEFEAPEEQRAEPEVEAVVEARHKVELEAQDQAEALVPKGNDSGPPESGIPHTTPVAGGSPAPASGAIPTAVTLKATTGKPSTKHGKRRRHKHHHGKKSGGHAAQTNKPKTKKH